MFICITYVLYMYTYVYTYIYMYVSVHLNSNPETTNPKLLAGNPDAPAVILSLFLFVFRLRPGSLPGQGLRLRVRFEGLWSRL